MDMPYLLTHTCFASRVLSRLQTKPADAAAYYLGCGGPDPYFFDAFLPTPFKRSRYDLGSRLHDVPGDVLFGAFLAEGTKADLPFIEGMLCHFCLDAAAHPYIESRARGLAHSQMEVSIDMALYPKEKERMGAPVKRQQGADLKPIDALMTRVIRSLFQEETAGVYLRAAKKYLLLHRLSFDPRGWKLAVLQAVEKPFSKKPALSGLMLTPGRADPTDVCNGKKAFWAAPWAPEQKRNESFWELFLEGEDECVRLLQLLENGEKEAFLQGLSNATMGKRRC